MTKREDDPRFDTRGAAKYLDVPPSTLIWWRHMGRGPAYEKAEGRVRYRQSHLDEYLDSIVVKPSTAAA